MREESAERKRREKQVATRKENIARKKAAKELRDKENNRMQKLKIISKMNFIL